jgi:hypothetical protein
VKVFKKILCVSDLHIPYHHKDTIPFLKSILKKYKPDKVVLLGDELDYHSLSFHDSDPDLDSAGAELEKSLNYMQGIFSIIPKADILESNHGSMVYRKALHNGMPRHLLKSYKEVLDAPKDWKWHPSLTLKMGNGQKVTFAHGRKKNVLAEAQIHGHSFVQGHHHSQADVRFYSVNGKIHFGMTVGCSIDNKSYAFAYNKNFTAEPVISHGLIENGIARILIMPMKKGRWTGETP